jgi:PRTRC genetic system protein C
MTAAIVKMHRVFRLGATDLPDPDPELEPEQVMAFYAEQYPNLKYGKVTEAGSEGDALVFTLNASEYKANG